ncbi:General transcription and DNA repair factor IIH subunit TFB4 [Bienertia sinuspersici]
MASVASKLYTDDVSLVVLSFVNSILLFNQLNQVVIIATGFNTCGYIYDSSLSSVASSISANLSSGDAKMPGFCSEVLKNLEEFMDNDESLSSVDAVNGVGSSLFSGSLSMALCYIQRVFRSGPLHPQPRILCLHGSPDGPEQYVAVMNSIFSAQRSMASYITGGVYLKPQQLDGLFQYLSEVHTASKPVGVDFRASSVYGRAQSDASSASGQKRKDPS